jgi:tetratricopeptide (TPR) repeat protein
MPTVATAPVTEPPVLMYARLLRDVHALIAQEKGDTDEAEALADRMDAPWYAMSPKEQERMRGLSADLYALREGGTKRVVMSAEQLQEWQREAREAYARHDTGDVDGTLAFLRRPSPASLPGHVIPFLQARCWEKLGDLETALVFMKEAERLDPSHALSVLTLLQRINRPDELAVYADRVITLPSTTPEELYLAATSLLFPTRGMSDAEARPTLKKIVPVLHRALSEYLALPRERRELPDLDAYIAQALGLCYERLGDLKSAVLVYDDALARHPRDGELLMARGLARYGSDPQNALRDLRAAVRWGVGSIWPYFLLSRHALQAGLPHEALRLAFAALGQPGSAAPRAEVHETIAIALAELGQPLERVLENFNTAVALDPNNDRIRRNRDIAAAPPEERPGAHTKWRRLLSPPPPVKAESLRRARGREINNRFERVNEHYSDRVDRILIPA